MQVEPSVVRCSLNFYSISQITSEEVVTLGNALHLFLLQSETEGEQELCSWLGRAYGGAVTALQSKPNVEALPAQPLPWALDISSQAEVVYYGIKTM